MTHWWGCCFSSLKHHLHPVWRGWGPGGTPFIPLGIPLIAAGWVEGGKRCLMGYPGYGQTPLAFTASHPCQVCSRTQKCIFLEIVYIPGSSYSWKHPGMSACLAKAGRASCSFTERQGAPWLLSQWSEVLLVEGTEMSLGQVNTLAHAGRLEKWVRKWGTCSCKLWHHYTERLCDSQDKLPVKPPFPSAWAQLRASAVQMEPRWGNAGDAHYSHQGLHIVLSLVSRSWGRSAHYVLYSVCAFEHLNHPVTQAWSFGTGCAGDTMGLLRVELVLGAQGNWI